MSQGSTKAFDIWQLTLDTWHLTLDTWHFTYATKHRHESKSCSACPKINISIWHLTLDTWHFTYMPLLSIYMKTKVVQHVPRINLSIWHLTLDTWQMTLLDTWHFTYATFEHRHENKSCSLCPKDQHKYLEHLTHVTHVKLERFPAPVWLSDIFSWEPFSTINSDFWASTWKQKLFSVSRRST